MAITEVTDIFRDGITVAFKLVGPMLIMSMAVGVLVAILQAVTQIHEQSIAFLLKLIVVVAFLIVAGHWMLETLQEFAKELLSLVT